MIVKGSTPEFDYPKGRTTSTPPTMARTASPIGGLASRSLFAWYFGDANILLSRLHHRREQDHASSQHPGSRGDDRAVPRLDRDPYMAVSEGRLYWIQDAYTTSEWFPYAQPASDGGDINYIRNSVKIVIDAYNGTVSFYVADAADPIVATYRRSSPRCSSRSMRCRRICKSTFATPRTSSHPGP